jgi:hypothetical protein
MEMLINSDSEKAQIYEKKGKEENTHTILSSYVIYCLQIKLSKNKNANKPNEH